MMPSIPVLVALLLALATPCAAKSGDGKDPQIAWGVNGHPLTAYKGVTAAEQLDLMQKLGVTSYRVDIYDERSVPALRELFREGKKRGITILPVITPKLSFTLSSSAELYKRARDRAIAIIGALKDEIRVWELGNEIENYAIIRACEMRDDGSQYNCSWGPAGGTSPLDYYGPRWAKASAVLKGLSDGAKAVDPSIRRAMGTAGWGHTGAFERMRADGIEWDISVWHVYGQDPEWAFKILAGYGKPIWVTEFNHPGGSTDGTDAQANGLVRMMSRLKTLAAAYRVEAAHIYELYDEPYWAPSYEASMGLYTLERSGDETWRPGKPKPAFDAVRDYLAGRTRIAAETAGGETTGSGRSGGNLAARNCVLPDAQASERIAREAKPGESILAARVGYAYCLILGRDADGDGMRAWLASLARPMSISEMLEGMIRSAEFNGRYGVDGLKSAEFVALLYRLLLMREPDGGGLAEYVAALDQGKTDRAGVVRTFLASQEFVVRHPMLTAPIAAAATVTR